jgi:hypothetical protein
MTIDEICEFLELPVSEKKRIFRAYNVARTETEVEHYLERYKMLALIEDQDDWNEREANQTIHEMVEAQEMFWQRDYNDRASF